MTQEQTAGYMPWFRMPIDGDVLWLDCCPRWLTLQPSALEVMQFSFVAKDGNLSAYYSPNSNYIPVALMNAFRSCDAGINSGFEEKRENDKRSKKIK